MVNFEYKDSYRFYDLVELVRLLRSEDGCPWDREQTHESVRRNFLEEAYEAVEAIDTGDSELLREELGDVLMQVVFHSRIEEEKGGFNIDDVADGLCRKLLERHPHVFQNDSVTGSTDVLDKWDAIKRRQKGLSTHASAMDAVARSLPSLWRAEKIQNKAAKTGFDWENAEDAIAKLYEEINELRDAAVRDGNVREELGDLLFSAVNVARFIGVDPEQALADTCDKFIRRFKYIEDRAADKGVPLDKLGLKKMDELWEEAKQLSY